VTRDISNRSYRIDQLNFFHFLGGSEKPPDYSEGGIKIKFCPWYGVNFRERYAPEAVSSSLVRKRYIASTTQRPHYTNYTASFHSNLFVLERPFPLRASRKSGCS
jgi:hypothetical protein